MVDDLISDFDRRINASGDNVKCYLNNDEPLLTKEWSYAIIVEVEDDQKTGRVSAVWNDRREIGTLVLSIIKPGTQIKSFRGNGNCNLNSYQLEQLLKGYLPKHLQDSRTFDLTATFEGR